MKLQIRLAQGLVEGEDRAADLSSSSSLQTMCLCSQLQAASAAGAVITEGILDQLEKFLETTYGFLSENQELIRKLPFNLTKRKVQTQTDQRISKIFNYNPFEHSTQTVLHSNYADWDANPSKFLHQLHNLQSIQTLDPQQFIVSLCLQVAEKDAYSAILRRIYCYVLGGLRDRETQKFSAKRIGESIYSELYNGEGDVKELIKTVAKLIEAGSRYRNIANRLGLGSLFVLGTEIATTVWEKCLPVKGQLFEDSVAHLEQKGIVASGKFYESLASRIVTILENRLPKAPIVQWVGAKKRHSGEVPKTKAKKRQRCDISNESQQTTQLEENVAEGCGSHNGTEPGFRALVTVAEQHLHGLNARYHECPQNLSVESSSVEGGRLTHTRALAESTSMQPVVIGQLPTTPMSLCGTNPSNAFVSSMLDPAVEGIGREQLMQNTTFLLRETGIGNPEALNDGNNRDSLGTYCSILDTLGTYGQTACNNQNAVDIRNLDFDNYHNAVDIRNLDFDNYHNAVDIRNLNFGDYQNTVDIRNPNFPANNLRSLLPTTTPSYDCHLYNSLPPGDSLPGPDQSA